MSPPFYSYKALLCLFLSLQLSSIHSKNILFLFPISSRSQTNVFFPLIQQLSQKGHNITTISPVNSSLLKNVSQIVPYPSENLFPSLANPFELRKLSPMKRLVQNAPHLLEVCSLIYENEQVQHLIKYGQFDLIVVNAVANQCLFGMIPGFQAPVVSLMTAPAANFVTEHLGTHLSPSYIPLSFLNYTSRMNFKERVVNSLIQWFIRVASYFHFRTKVNFLNVKYHGEDSQSISEIERNFSVLLVNTHFSMNIPLPLGPDVVEVGGMHCRQGEEIQQKDLRNWLDSAEEGFIYLSFGSIIQGQTMPEKYRNIFVNVFSKLGVKVLWKWDTESDGGRMGDLPGNVRLEKWLPQQDILAHPKIRLFITHGGLLSLQEAVFHAVPVLGLPFFADQDHNTAQAVANGIGLSLEILDLCEEKLATAINSILNNNTFDSRVEERSSLFRDQPQSPMERAVFWIEYAIRTKGAVHLRSASRDLYLFQYHSYDVILFLIFSTFIFIKILKKCLRLCCSCSTNKPKLD